jgi:aconitate hydratase 2/2-methylisocitrate dehydratase
MGSLMSSRLISMVAAYSALSSAVNNSGASSHFCIVFQQGLLTVEKTNKKNIFSGRILEIEGLGDLKIEQAFELTDASAERSSNGCTIKLNQAPVAEYLQSNIALLSSMIEMDYEDKKTIARRIQTMQKWLDAPELLTADDNAEYAATIEINLDLKVISHHRGHLGKQGWVL